VIFRIRLDGIRGNRPERWRLFLIGDEMGLRRKRQSRKRCPIERRAYFAERPGVKAVPRQNRRKEVIQTGELPLADDVQRRPFNVGVQTYFVPFVPSPLTGVSVMFRTTPAERSRPWPISGGGGSRNNRRVNSTR
jgi:hypothetical protein